MNEMENQRYDRTYAVVDLDIIRENVLSAKRSLPEGCKFCAVLKADAYGHGAPAVAKAIDDLTDMYGVASVEEGGILRSHGIKKPILDLGVVPESSYERMLEEEIMPSVFTRRQAEAISRLALEAGKTAEIMLALDTGMGRIGIQTEEPGALLLAEEIAALPGLHIQGAFSHFASADEADKRYTRQQLSRFLRFTGQLEERGIELPVKHCANSAGLIEGFGTELDMVRDGISIYGLYPSAEVSRERIALRPALSWKAQISYVKTVPAGTAISYGSTFVTERETRIATIPVGYADGFPRALSNRAEVLIRGRRCRILGRICMDQFMADVSGLEPEMPEIGEPVTLLGQDGEENITLYEWEGFGLFPYEVLCGIGKRVPRVYIQENRVIGAHDAFGERYADFRLR